MEIRNIAIIAHVDHGKTTLVDSMLKQAGTFREGEKIATRVMDSGDIERERGITILSKCTSINWNNTRINIVDTPGHADFGGEVERILNMVDSAILLVDSAEGVMPQTKFVLSKALASGLAPIVVINKIDREDRREKEVLNEIFDLFISLGATDTQADFPVLYASGRDGFAVENIEEVGKVGNDLKPLFNLIIKHTPAPKINSNSYFSMLVSTLSGDNFLGRILTGKIMSGKVKVNDKVKALNISGEVLEETKITKILSFRGLNQVPLEEAEAGDIVSLAGFKIATVGDTVGSLELLQPIASTPIDPPTIAVTFEPNTSPFAGREGDKTKLQSRTIFARLKKEAESNIALKVSETEGSESFTVAGRGELQLGILIEEMRREGFEFSVSKPKVIFKEVNGIKLEPFEEVVIDTDEIYSGVVIEKLTRRRGIMQELINTGTNKVRIIFKIPSRCIIGYEGEFKTDTHGSGILNKTFSGYENYAGGVEQIRGGSLVSMEEGKATAYSLFTLQDRGKLFITPGTEVYSGMIIGEHAKENDLEINPIRAKQLTNLRAAGHDEALILSPPKIMNLETMMAYIRDDEMLEVTPKNIRMRKRELNASIRHKQLGKKSE